jgi:hypothetical protein
MKKRIAVFIATLVLLLAGLACQLSSNLEFGSSSASSVNSSTFERKTETIEQTLEVKDEMNSMTLKGKIHLTQGNLSLEIIDPDGEVRYTIEAGRKNIKINKRFEPIPGIWTMKIAFEEAAGSYDLRWNASN